jgi:hypothetical protein
MKNKPVTTAGNNSVYLSSLKRRAKTRIRRPPRKRAHAVGRKVPFGRDVAKRNGCDNATLRLAEL